MWNPKYPIYVPTEVKIHYRSFFARLMPKKYDAFTLGSHVFVKQDFMGAWLLSHELIHVLQYRRLGIVGFLVKYLFLRIKNERTKHPMEIEAWERGWRIMEAIESTIGLQTRENRVYIYPDIETFVNFSEGEREPQT